MTLPNTEEKKVFTKMQLLSRKRVVEGNGNYKRVSAKRFAVAIWKTLRHQKQKQNRHFKI